MYFIKTTIYSFVMLLLCLHEITSLSSNQISSFTDSEDSSSVQRKSDATICRQYPGLKKKQRRLCKRKPDVTATALQGIDLGIKMCEYQLQNRRWNCSNLQTRNGNPFKATIMKKTFRESAFVRAIVSAGILYKVTTACSMGLIRSCGCDTSYRGEEEDFQWGGCSHDIEYGKQIAATFMDSMDKHEDVRSKINKHNNKAGRLAIVRHTEKHCRCHGVTGSCQMQTCWMQTPEFKDVGQFLKEKYTNASEVQARNNNNGAIEVVTNDINTGGRRAPEEDLIFLDRSPDFCDYNPSAGSLGTRDRYCNRTSDDFDGCDSMCCGRGYNIRLEPRTKWCNCVVHWCCKLSCRKCHTQEWVTQCK